jgi:hypothetical protein
MESEWRKGGAFLWQAAESFKISISCRCLPIGLGVGKTRITKRSKHVK